MRCVTEQRANTVAPHFQGTAIIHAGLDDCGGIGRVDHIRDWAMPVSDQSLQLGFCTIGIVGRALRFVRCAPPGSATRPDWNDANPNAPSKGFRQETVDWLIRNSAPALIAAIEP